MDASVLAAKACCEAGRWDDAEHWIGLYSGIPREKPWCFGVDAQLSARRGDLDGALRLAHRAAELAEKRDGLNYVADILVVLAGIQRAAGLDDEADEAVERALALYEHKGNVTSAGRLRSSIVRA